jgi:DNA-binding NarL/FixJ family response regulator
MIRVLVVADSGEAMAAITAPLSRLQHVDIVAFASGRSPIGRLVGHADPDVVLVDEMRWPGLAPARIAEIRAAAPRAAVVGVTPGPQPDWAGQGVLAAAEAVVTRTCESGVLAHVLQDVLRERTAPRNQTTERSAA